jgi:hypothetical protein
LKPLSTALGAHTASNGHRVALAPAWAARPASDDQGAAAPDAEDLVDLLTAAELRIVLTEALLAEVPTITAAQLVGVRDCVMALAEKYEWVD